MNWAISIAIYLTVWWTVLFAILPIGVKSQHESDEMVPGTEPGAPVAPKLLMKAGITTLVSAVVFAGIWYLMDGF